MQKIGFYSGSFDPIHLGHAAFAESAIKSLELDILYVLPEPVPWRKNNVTDILHRQRMVDLMFGEDMVVRTKLEGLLNSVDVDKTLDVLKKEHPDSKLYILLGADEFLTIETWHNYERLIQEVEFVIALRTEDDGEMLVYKLQELPDAKATKIVTGNATYSSSKVRSQILNGEMPTSISLDIYDYIKQNKLYASTE